MRRWMSCLLIAAFSALLCGCNQQTDEISGQSNASSESTQSGVSDETSSEEAASDTLSSDETENSAQPLMSLEE